METIKPLVCLITGPAGAGKSTVANLLAKVMKKSAIIETDHLRHAIKSGYIKPSLPEADGQLVLGRKNAAILGQNFASEGFSAVIVDCVAGKKYIDIYSKYLRKFNFIIILLMPNKKVLMKRDSERSRDARIGKRTLFLHNRFEEKMKNEKRWHVIDNSNMTPPETLKQILHLFESQKLPL